MNNTKFTRMNTTTSTDTSLEDASAFAFLSLPAEVRNEVYELLVVDPKYCIRVSYGVINQVQKGIICPRNPQRIPYDGLDAPPHQFFRLRLTNQQLNKEASAIFYTLNHFKFCVGTNVPSLHKAQGFERLNREWFWEPEYAEEFETKPVPRSLFEQVRQCTFHSKQFSWTYCTLLSVQFINSAPNIQDSC